MKNISANLRVQLHLVAICLLVACLMSSCGPKENMVRYVSSDSDTPDRLKVTKLVYADSVINDSLHLVARFSAELPESVSTPLELNIAEWVSEQLGGTYNGDFTDGQSMLQYYAEDHLDGLADFSAPRYAYDWEVISYEDYKIEKVYETKQYVSFMMTMDSYYGGAHGSHVESGITLRKLDGRRVNWDFFQKSKTNQLKALIKKNILLQHYNTDDEDNVNECWDLCLQDPYASFPYPETPPIFTRKGAKFIYQEYEIACYADGLPTCVIPYEALDSLFTSSAQQMVE